MRTAKSVAALGAWTIVFAVLAAMLGLAGSASAAQIPNAITSVTTNATTVGQWDQVNFNCTWAVPDGSKAGDTFTMQLPSQLQWWGSADFDLKDPAGNVVATAHANADGSVVFTLTDYVTTHPQSVHGTCNFQTQYTASQSGPGPEDLVFTVGSQTIRIPITDRGSCTTDCGTPAITGPGKSMWWANSQQTVLQSFLSVKTGDNTSNDVTVVDNPGAGMVLDCTSVAPSVGPQLNQDSSIADPNDDAKYPATINCTPNQLTVSWTGLPAQENVEVWVRTNVTDTSLDTYTNNGTITLNGDSAPVSAQAVAKNASGTGDGTSPTPTPTPTTSTPTPTPTPTTSTPTPTPTPTTSTPTPTPTTSTPKTTPAKTTPAKTTPAKTTTSSNGVYAVQITADTTPSTTAVAVPSTGLAFTGTNTLRTVALGAALLGLGGLLLQLGRRRRTGAKH